MVTNTLGMQISITIVQSSGKVTSGAQENKSETWSDFLLDTSNSPHGS